MKNGLEVKKTDAREEVGPPGFEPESMAPKATRIGQATLRAH